MIAITLGDPGGIGPEIVLKSLEVIKGDFIIVGSFNALKEASKKLSIEIPNYPFIDIKGRYFKGGVFAENGEIAFLTLKRGIELALEGRVQGIVTAPVSKEAMSLAGHRYPGQTEILAEMTGTEDYAMLMVSEKLKILLLTTHIPISKVSESITEELIVRKVSLLNKTLRKRFKIDEPRILILGLNPHAGEGGYIGNEEVETIKPAIEKLRREGVLVDGPVPPDTFFMKEGYDSVVAMYHDQGMIPFKLSSFGSGVNMTIGLPFVRTSPDHGTAFDIAGRGIANPDSMISAIQLCRSLCC